jgi:hypothetical protein
MLQESGVSISTDVTADTEEISQAVSSDSNSDSGSDSSSASTEVVDTSSAVEAVSEQVTEAASSGELDTAMTESISEVADEEGDTSIVSAAASMSVDPDKVEAANLSPTPFPTTISVSSGTDDTETMPVTVIASAVAGVMFLAGLAWLIHNHRVNAEMRRAKKCVSVDTTADGSNNSDLESNNFHNLGSSRPYSPGAKRKPRLSHTSTTSSNGTTGATTSSVYAVSPSSTPLGPLPTSSSSSSSSSFGGSSGSRGRGSFREEGISRSSVVICGGDGSDHLAESAHAEHDVWRDRTPEKEKVEEEAASVSSILPRFVLALSPSFLLSDSDASPAATDKGHQQHVEHDEESMFRDNAGYVDDDSSKDMGSNNNGAYAMPVNIRNKNNRRRRSSAASASSRHGGGRLGSFTSPARAHAPLPPVRPPPPNPNHNSTSGASRKVVRILLLYIVLPSFLVFDDVSVSLSIYYCPPAFSDTTRH